MNDFLKDKLLLLHKISHRQIVTTKLFDAWNIRIILISGVLIKKSDGTEIRSTVPRVFSPKSEYVRFVKT